MTARPHSACHTGCLRIKSRELVESLRVYRVHFQRVHFQRVLAARTSEQFVVLHISSSKIPATVCHIHVTQVLTLVYESQKVIFEVGAKLDPSTSVHTRAYSADV